MRLLGSRNRRIIDKTAELYKYMRERAIIHVNKNHKGEPANVQVAAYEGYLKGFLQAFHDITVERKGFTVNTDIEP